jgi:hypothetical protein
MEKTPNYGLNKPDVNDFVSPVPLNENADFIDVALRSMQEQISGLPTGTPQEVIDIGAKVGDPGDAASATGATLFSLIKWAAARFTGFWTDARAALLDRLDAAVSTRAAAADWTAARAAKVDSLDAAVSSRAPASTAVSNADLTLARIKKLDDITPSIGSIKSVQRGVVNLPNNYQESYYDVTISPVSSAKSVIVSTASLSHPTGAAIISVTLLNPTTVRIMGTLYRYALLDIPWQVVELN